MNIPTISTTVGTHGGKRFVRVRIDYDEIQFTLDLDPIEAEQLLDGLGGTLAEIRKGAAR